MRLLTFRGRSPVKVAACSISGDGSSTNGAGARRAGPRLAMARGPTAGCGTGCWSPAVPRACRIHLWQFGDQFAEAAEGHRPVHGVGGCLGTGVDEVVVDPARRQGNVLREERDRVTHVRQRKVAQVDVAERDAPAGGVVEADQKLGQSGLAGAAGAGDGQEFPRRDGEMDPVKPGTHRCVVHRVAPARVTRARCLPQGCRVRGVADVLDPQRERSFREGCGRGGIVDLRVGVKEFLEPLGRRQRPGHVQSDLPERGQGRVEEAEVGGERQ